MSYKSLPAVGTWVIVREKHKDRVLPGMVGVVGRVTGYATHGVTPYAKVAWENGTTRDAPLDVLSAAPRQPKRNPGKGGAKIKPPVPVGAIGVAQYIRRWPASGAKKSSKKRNPASGGWYVVFSEDGERWYAGPFTVDEASDRAAYLTILGKSRANYVQSAPKGGRRLPHVSPIEFVRAQIIKAGYRPMSDEAGGYTHLSSYKKRNPSNKRAAERRAGAASRKRNPAFSRKALDTLAQWASGGDAVQQVASHWLAGRTVSPEIVERAALALDSYGDPEASGLARRLRATLKKRNPVRSWVVVFSPAPVSQPATRKADKRNVARMVERWGGKLGRGGSAATFANRDDAEGAVRGARAWGVDASMSEKKR